MKAPKDSKWNAAMSILAAMMAVAFLIFGGAKLSGSEEMTRTFAGWGYPPWFMRFTGVLEMVGGIMLIFPRARFRGALALCMIMIGAVMTHLVNGEMLSAIPALGFLFLLTAQLFENVPPLWVKGPIMSSIKVSRPARFAAPSGMKTFTLNEEYREGFWETEKTVSQVFIKHGYKPVLLGWYDRERRVGGPMEVCGKEPFKAARDYATSLEAEAQVRTQDRKFTYFYRTVKDFTELDREAALELHRGLAMDRFENVQGG